MNSIKRTFDYENKRWGLTPISSIYTDFQGLELLYFLKDVLPLIKTQKVTLLDLGCGAGNVAGFFKKNFPDWRIIGIDISADSISVAKNNFSGIQFILTPAHKLPLKDQTVTCVTALDTLEHFKNLDAVLDEIHRVLSARGLFYVSIPLERQMPSLYGLFYKLGWRGKMDFAGHVNFFTHRELQKRIEQHGFRLVKERFSYHLFFSIADIGYYFLQSFSGNQDFSFETTVYNATPGLKKTILSFMKKTISAISYLESRLLYWFPGGKGHFVFLKTDKEDFFSASPPITVLEEYQRKIGMKKMIRPKDLHIMRYLKLMKFNRANIILDFGCASGVWLERLLVDSDALGIGVDISEKLIDYANGAPNRKGKYYNTIHNWPLKPHSVDFCISFDVFEHIKDVSGEIRKIYAAMSKESMFLFYTLNPGNKFTFDWLFEKLGSNILYTRADHKKEMFIEPYTFANILKKEGFSDVAYALYDGPVNLSWDVFCYGYLLILQKIFSFLRIQFLMKPVLFINDLIVRKITPVNDRADKLFFSKGYSNGYFIWGKKV